MKLTLEVLDGEERRPVTAGPAEFLAFEDRFDVNAGVCFPPQVADPAKPSRAEVKALQAWAARTRQSWWYFLAWHALHRTGETALPFGEWPATVDGVDLGTAAAEPTTEDDPPTETGTPPTGE